MARGFNTTLGVASTDRIQTTLAAHGMYRTYAMWSYQRTAGVNGSMLDKSNAGVQFERIQDSSDGTNTYQYKRTWSGGIAQWGATRPAAAVWTHVAVTYIGSATSNVPIFYYNAIPQSVTTQVAASGTLSANTDFYWIGNRGNADRGWDGMIAEVGIWDRILSPVEIQLLAAGYSPAIFKAGLVEYVPLDGTIESKVRGPFKPIATGTLWKNHPSRIIQPTRISRVFFDLPAPATGTLSKTLDAATIAATGTVQVSGTSAVTLDAVTGTLTGGVQVSGTLAKTLDDATIAATGTDAAGGTLSATLGAVTVAAEGTGISVTLGTLDKQLDALTATITGAVAVHGSLSETLADVGLAAAGGAPLTTPLTLRDRRKWRRTSA